MGVPGSGKGPACQCRRCKRHGFIPGSGKSPGGGHSNPLQYSCLENRMVRKAWWAVVQWVAKSWTQLKRLSTQAHTNHLVVSDSSWPHGLQLTRFLCPWGFSRQEYWNGWPCPPPGDLPNPGIKPRPPIWQANSLPSEPPPGKPPGTEKSILGNNLYRKRMWKRINTYIWITEWLCYTSETTTTS